MNLILFEQDEIGRPLSPRDPRSVHLRTILGARPGDSFAAGILGGRKGRLEILSLTEAGVDYRFTPDEDSPPLLPLELIIGAPRPLVTKRLLKDLTTLGLKALHFVTAELGEKSYLESGLWRNEEYRRHLREGAEQSGVTLLPEIRRYSRLRDCLMELPPGARRFVLDPARGRLRAREAVLAGEPVLLAIGPERGWTEAELDRFEAAGFEPLRMGERILRTEAAALAASAIFLSRMGYM